MLLQLCMGALLLVMAGCSGPDPAKLIESAQSNIAKGDTNTAIIELKTVLQQRPDAGQARYLLGKALLAKGDATGAAVELRKALELNHAANDVVPELAQSMFLLGQHEKLVQEFDKTKLTAPQAIADLNLTLAEALVLLGRTEQARSAADASLAAVPGYGPANLFKIRLQAGRGDVDGALAALDAELAKRPRDHKAWTLKASLLHYVKRDVAGALAAYRQAIAGQPKDLDAHSGALTLLLDERNLEVARTQLAEMREAFPNSPLTQYFEGYLALLERKFDRALEITQQLLRVAPGDPRALQLAGLVQFERGSFVQAEPLLAKALQVSPGLGLARRALTLTHLGRGEPVKALAVMQPLLEQPNPYASDLKMKAQAHMQQGDLAKAEEAFARAAKIDPDNPVRQTDLAVSKILRGDVDTGLAMLRSLAADKDSSAADMPLIAALIQRRDFPGALQAIEIFEKKQPDRPVAANLRARVLLAQGNRQGATQAFEQALKIQPSFLPAASGLAELALADNRPAVAQKYLDDALSADPRSSEALLANASLKARIGAPKEDILALFNGAIRGAPQDRGLHVALIGYLLESKDRKGAIEAAQRASAALPDDPDVVEMLGRAQLAAGEANQAAATFGKLAGLLPNSPMPHMRLAQVHHAAKDREAEIQSLKRALAIAPDNLPTQRVLINAHLAKGEAAAALEVARKVQQQRPKQDEGYLFEGTIEGGRQRFDQAVQAYRAGMKATGGTSELVMGLHAALTAAKQQAQADKQAAEWLRTHPRDTVFRFYLGDLAMAQGDLASAETRYRDVLKIQPDQAQALNNVAWLMAKAQKPGAVAMAERALRLQPNSSSFMDTLALALAADGQSAKAVQQAKKALAIDDKNPALRLNLARLMIQAGDKADAKVELESLAALKDAFPYQKEVAELLKSL